MLVASVLLVGAHIFSGPLYSESEADATFTSGRRIGGFEVVAELSERSTGYKASSKVGSVLMVWCGLGLLVRWRRGM